MFACNGSFDDDELRAALPGLGFPDADVFLAEMAGEEVRRRVQEDIEAAEAVGLDSTPLIFVNGVELKGPGVTGIVTEALHELLAGDLPPRSAASDRGPERL